MFEWFEVVPFYPRHLIVPAVAFAWVAVTLFGIHSLWQTRARHANNVD